MSRYQLQGVTIGTKYWQKLWAASVGSKCGQQVWAASVGSNYKLQKQMAFYDRHVAVPKIKRDVS